MIYLWIYHRIDSSDDDDETMTATTTDHHLMVEMPWFSPMDTSTYYTTKKYWAQIE
jgi:hypothetical protein